MAALEREGFLRRYARAGDGAPDGEGAFVDCSLWHADALAATGEPGRAWDAFESGCCRSATTSACRPSRGTRSPAANWATLPTRSATSPWSRPPSPFGHDARSRGADTAVSSTIPVSR
jgi:hypothetical protein